MLLSELFKSLECQVPLHLALPDDKVGFIGPGKPDEIEVEKVAVTLDILPETDYESWEVDLLVCHHPPLFHPTLPTYIIHSNWDTVQGGANDALAQSLKLKVTNVLEESTGIGRICDVECSFEDFQKKVLEFLDVDQLRTIKVKDGEIKKIAVISGFGLNPHYIKLAREKGIDLLLSGDLTHPGAILARKIGINLIDATHQATEVPGLIKLCQLLNGMGVITTLKDLTQPWEIHIHSGNII